MFSFFSFTNKTHGSSTKYTQDYLFRIIILPTFEAYPEIAWFADDGVAATSEGTASSFPEKSWTSLLVKEKKLTEVRQSNKKYIELERMLHSLVCFNLILDGSEAAYNYWIQEQKTYPLSKDAFDKLHILAKELVVTPEIYKAIEASLVYSDVGKTPEAKRRAMSLGIAKEDHDDFMEALYSASAEIRGEIIPSFEQLNKNVQTHILDLHLAVPLHWGHVVHLEGGEGMFSKLTTSKKAVSFIKHAFLIQVCDVAAAQAHVNPRGFIAFNQASYLGYQMVLEIIEDLLRHGDTKIALMDLTNRKAKQLGYSKKEDSEKYLILARIGSFLRLYTEEEGDLLKKAADYILTNEDWLIIQQVLGLESGINEWKRNPTYMPAVLINLFNSTNETPENYQRALSGMLILAKIGKEYQSHGYNISEVPLCFNNLAAQAKNNPEFFNKQFDEASQINWSNPKNITIIFSPSNGNPKMVPR